MCRIVPMTLVVLGAFFYSPPVPQPPQEESTASTPSTARTKTSFFERKFRALANPQASNSHPGENRAVFVAVLSRMIIVPALLLPFLAWIAVRDCFKAADDPVFIVSNWRFLFFVVYRLIISYPPTARCYPPCLVSSGTDTCSDYASSFR